MRDIDYKCKYCEIMFPDIDSLHRHSSICLARNTFENLTEIEDSFDPPI